MSNPVLFQELKAQGGKQIAIATLNQESSLNALSLDMVNLLKAQLETWKNDDSVVCVVLRGAGEKAFCAGGDVQALYRSAIASPGQPCVDAEEFFDQEYRLDYLLHSYPKPVICWGHGIVMGGGLGLMAGCSHVVVTEKTRVAMPEITIGLYPDVGGSWFLNMMPDKTGLFLALTGASINAKDCLFVGLSNLAVSSDRYDDVLAPLAEISWDSQSRNNSEQINSVLDGFAQESSAAMPDGNLQTHLQQIKALCSSDNPYELINGITSMETEDAWLVRARDSLKAGSPLSALIIYHQLEKAKELNLVEVFKSEYMLSTNMVRYPDFAEGVRALLIDKDRNPQWQFKQIEDVPEELLNSFFEPPQTGSTWPVNPLNDLGA